MDKGTLYNLALSYLGDRRYKTDAATAAACDGCGAHCVALALDYTPWSFATVSSTLTLTDGAAELPHDCLRLQSVGLKKFALRGRRLTDLTGGRIGLNRNHLHNEHLGSECQRARQSADLRGRGSTAHRLEDRAAAHRESSTRLRA